MKCLQILKAWLPCILAIALVYCVMFALGITCPIRFLTGVSCPGCGMTRAVVSALRLDFKTAFDYHPLWILLLPVAITLVILWRKGKRKAFHRMLYGAASVAVLVYALRFFFPSEIVVFRPQEGFFARLLGKIVSIINSI